MELLMPAVPEIRFARIIFAVAHWRNIAVKQYHLVNTVKLCAAKQRAAFLAGCFPSVPVYIGNDIPEIVQTVDFENLENEHPDIIPR